MRSSVLAVLLLAAACSAMTLPPHVAAFRSWMRKHGKMYTGEEYVNRMNIWQKNVAIVAALNAEHSSATFAVNKFADLTEEEFRTRHLGFVAPRNKDLNKIVVIPDDVDTTADYNNTLPAAKDQGSCGGCWAFSAVANAEGQTYRVNGHKVVSLSEQQILDCDTYCDEEGCYVYKCNGGRMDQADEWILTKNNGSLTSEEQYKYVGENSKCANHKSVEPVAFFKDRIFWGAIENDTEIILHVDEYGPLSVAVAAGGHDWMHYESGVLDSKRCSTTPNHGVTLVGYGTDENGVKYWHIRNSWGAAWGDAGHLKIIRGKNMCAINSQISTIVA